MAQANLGSSIQKKFLDKTGDAEYALTKGLKISLAPGPDGKYEIVDTCQYCNKQDNLFKERAIFENHVKNRCKMIVNCQYCHDLVEAPEFKDHRLHHCKKGPHI